MQEMRNSCSMLMQRHLKKWEENGLEPPQTWYICFWSLILVRNKHNYQLRFLWLMLVWNNTAKTHFVWIQCAVCCCLDWFCHQIRFKEENINMVYTLTWSPDCQAFILHTAQPLENTDGWLANHIAASHCVNECNLGHISKQMLRRQFTEDQIYPSLYKEKSMEFTVW